MREPNKKRCIVLLPVGQHFELLFNEILGPALRQTGLIASHLQWNARSPTPISVFVDEIEQAGALLADVSANTPEIWLATGCAVALGMPLCLISSRPESDLPFGIQHLPLIPYPADAFPRDYIHLQHSITAQLSAIMPRSEIAESQPQLRVPALSSVPVAKSSDDLVSYEILALTIIDRKSSATGLSPRALGVEMQASECGHLTSHAMNGLKRRRFIERKTVQITERNEVHTSDNLFLTRTGEEWLIRHGRRATVRRTTAHSRALLKNSR